MLVYDLQCALFGNEYFSQASRVVFKDPNISDGDKMSAGEDPDGTSAEGAVEVTREGISAVSENESAKESKPGITDNERYTFGRPFNLPEELKNGNISEKAGEFVRQWSVAEEALKSLYEYDAYTYIHTVQMLNEGCIIVENEFEKIKRIVESGKNEEVDNKFDLTDTDLKIMMFGAIVFHDWGKTRVDRKILNSPDKLDALQTQEMRRHPMETVDIIVSKIIDRVYLKDRTKKMKAQDLVRNILDSDDYPEEKRLLQMAYMAVSHHNYYSARDKYPSAEEISEILPDYNIWLESSGREQAIILAIFDVTDALLSDRPYKSGMLEEDAKVVLNKIFLENPNDKEKYGKIVDCILESWEKMRGADEYTEKRKKEQKRAKNNQK